MKSRIANMEGLTASHALSNIEFAIIRQMFTSFRDTIDDMSVEQKCAALRTFVKRWFGTASMFMCIYLALMTAAVLNKEVCRRRW